MPGYTLARKLRRPYAETVDLVRAAVTDHGFAVLTEIDLAATLNRKLDVDLRPELILGVCRAPLAYAAIRAEPSITALLPCNVVVRSTGPATTVVEVMDPAAMVALAGNDELTEVAADATRRIGAMLETLAAGTAPDPADPIARRA